MLNFSPALSELYIVHSNPALQLVTDDWFDNFSENATCNYHIMHACLPQKERKAIHLVTLLCFHTSIREQGEMYCVKFIQVFSSDNGQYSSDFNFSKLEIFTRKKWKFLWFWS